ncbi:MAG: glycosyltransferase family 4 protein [Nanobdellota archaeon]
MKKLLIATDGFLPRWDGIVRFLIELVPRLEKDYQIKIVAPKFPGHFINPFNSEVIRFDLMNRNFGDIQFSKVKAKSLEPYIEWSDLVFVQSLGTLGMKTIKLAKKSGKPTISFLHLIEWELATKSIKHFKRIARYLSFIISKKYYKMCDMLICPSEEMSLIYEKNGIKTPKKVATLGTDIYYFKPMDKTKAKERIGIGEETKIIGYHGRIGREKDLVTLYRAFRRVERKYSGVKLMIVGKGVKEMETIFSSDKNIIFPGSQDDVASYLQAMDIYVTPSLTETTSLSTLEAMSCGLPVISTPAGSVKEYISERENGMLFPFRNSVRLSMKIELLLNNKELREKLGKNARQTVKENFNWEKTYKDIKEVLGRF